MRGYSDDWVAALAAGVRPACASIEQRFQFVKSQKRWRHPGNFTASINRI
jgi:hypothetical protein